MDYTLQGSSAQRISQARILEWATISFSRGIFPTQGSNRRLFCLLHRQAGFFSLPRAPLGLPQGHSSKESICNAGGAVDTGSIPGLGRSPGGGNGNPLQYSCLENPMDSGAWHATVQGVTKSWTGLKHLSMHTCTRNIYIWAFRWR